MHLEQASTKFIRLLTLILLSASAGISAVKASPAASVSLIYFRAESESDGAHLQWQTATELNTVGFRIERATQEGGPYEGLTEIGVVPAQGSATSGHTYEVVDETIADGQPYWYRLVEIESDNDEHVLDTKSLTMGAPPTATIESISTSDSEATEQPQFEITTSTATSTASAATPTGQAATAQTSAAASPTPRTSPTTSNDAPVVAATQSVGNGVVEAAGQPTAVAQATGSYPEPPETAQTPDESYPGADQPPAATAIAPTPFQPQDTNPPGLANPDITPPVDSIPDNVVGSGAEDAATEDAGQQSSPWGRVLLWVGFVVALIIFIAGVFFSIVLSTRKQRRPNDPPGP